MSSNAAAAESERISMKKRNAMKVIGSVAGASVLLAGAAPAEVAANIDVPGGVL